MAELDKSYNYFQCPNCSEIDEHIVGNYKTRELDGKLFDADVTDGEALVQNSEKFKRHALINCAGEISYSCLEEFARQEITESASPLSKLFSRRIRARKCPHCRMLTSTSGKKLP